MRYQAQTTCWFGLSYPWAGILQLDHIARRSQDFAYSFLDASDLMCLLHWDSQFNDRFCCFSSVIAQTTGTLIGGSCSAQVACLTFALARGTHPCGTSILSPLLHYRGGFLVILDPDDKPNGYNIDRIMSVLSQISGMQLTNEGSGESLDFLESTLCLGQGVPCVSLKRPVLKYSVGMSSPPSPLNLLDPFSPNNQRMLRSLMHT